MWYENAQNIRKRVDNQLKIKENLNNSNNKKEE